jgi:hypothetical protein
MDVSPVGGFSTFDASAGDKSSRPQVSVAPLGDEAPSTALTVVAAQSKIDSGQCAVTTTFGMSTISLIRRSIATLVNR